MLDSLAPLTPDEHRAEALRLLERANDSTEYDEAAGIVAQAHVHAVLAAGPVLLEPVEGYAIKDAPLTWWQFCLVIIVLTACTVTPIWLFTR